MDIAIIGAGVSGLAVASEIARKGRDVYLLEKNDTFGQEQSSRNSEVIHAGIYYAPDSLKTRFCVEGNRLLYEMGDKHGIPCIRCGKIFIAGDDEEAETLEDLYYNGINNGLPLKMLSQAELHKKEPYVKGLSAFLSPTSGIIDSHALMRYFVLKARENEARIVYRTEVTGIEKTRDGYRLRVEYPEGEDYLDTRIVINCGGIYSDRVAELAGIDIDSARYRLYFTKGEFYSVGGGKNRMINTLVYPTPQNLGPGIHVCLDTEKRLRLGPLFSYVDQVDYSVDDSNRSIFEESTIMKCLPFITPEDIAPESAGIMAALYTHGEKVNDFVIQHEDTRGLPGFINLVGIDSPGLTASPAIGRYVARMVDEILG
ncbi:MAG: NAD(P)/FAD-dependent oxidoreductase [Dehalococcoidales bacterium]|nr:MAG: NAD(P)/FAD-dependent oxidoreductase [Dehalococcoidales bacterium]